MDSGGNRFINNNVGNRSRWGPPLTPRSKASWAQRHIPTEQENERSVQPSCTSTKFNADHPTMMPPPPPMRPPEYDGRRNGRGYDNNGNHQHQQHRHRHQNENQRAHTINDRHHSRKNLKRPPPSADGSSQKSIHGNLKRPPMPPPAGIPPVQASNKRIRISVPVTHDYPSTSREQQGPPRAVGFGTHNNRRRTTSSSSSNRSGTSESSNILPSVSNTRPSGTLDGDKKMPALPSNNITRSTSSSSSNNDNKSNSNSYSQDVIDLCSDEEDVLIQPPVNSKTDTTHIIFAIDFSGSMRERDVSKKCKKISRWDAVFECMEVFLSDQIKEQQRINKEEEEEDFDDVIEIDGEDSNKKRNCKRPAGGAIVSVLIFNDEAETLLSHMPLVGDGQKVLKALKTAQKMHTPQGGTGFSAGFECAKTLAATENESGKVLSEVNSRNIVLVFLSDGRPGDLHHHAPKNAEEPMQTTFRRNKNEFPAAGQHIEAMKRLHGDRFSLHLICICKDGKKWLNYLANRYNGTFHEPDLSVNGDSAPTTGAGGHNAVIADEEEVEFDDSSSEEEDIIEMVVKSRETLIRERHNRALAAGQVLSISNTTTPGGSSMRSTFQSISSSVTAMRGSNRLQERQGIVIKEKSPMIRYHATRMVWDAENEKIVVPPSETPNERIVKVSRHPFAQGGLRNVYRMQQSGQQFVAKESRHDVGYNERLRFHIETSKCQAKAAKYANKFNMRASTEKGLKGCVPKIKMLRAEVIRLKSERSPGGYRYLAAEKELKGEKYEKWNSNNGYLNPSVSLNCEVAQAFSHFSYEASKEREMVVDIQGSGYMFTDPQLHSVSKEFGRADRGKPGFKDFFKTHKCNRICKELGLKNRVYKLGALVKVENT